ncbi:hypothetical protein ARMGADRAFT_676376 [Armillaria gallica]|uniref:Uncharacterized protein n=1 Tax=Armillaria gallica TaxID=47427 RepID=A0A2H3CY27_ARMGA|nr:hypothetical protein ARMGADRAFT_676376 [Armillaria gallica]
MPVRHLLSRHRSPIAVRTRWRIFGNIFLPSRLSMHEGPRGALSQHMHDHPSSLPLINDGMVPAHAPCSPVLVGEDNLPLEGVFRTGTQEDKGRDMPSIMSRDHRRLFSKHT